MAEIFWAVSMETMVLMTLMMLTKISTEMKNDFIKTEFNKKKFE